MRRGLDALIDRATMHEKRLWRSWDLMGVESEVAEFLYTFVRAVKPANVVESGGGFSTCFLAAAIEDNGFGSLTSYEADANHAAKVEMLVRQYPNASVVNEPLPEDIDPLPDFVFIDSLGSVYRKGEMTYWLKRPVLLAIHDSYRYPELQGGFTLTTARGLWVRDRRER